MPTLRPLRTAAALAVLGSSPAFAAAYVGSAYEGFDYTAGLTMDGISFGTGTGFNATGATGEANTTLWGSATPYNANGNRIIANGSLTSPNVASPASVGNSVLVSGSGQIGRTLGQTVDSGTFYFSYLTQKTVDQVRTVNFSFFNGTSERLAVGQTANNTSTRDIDGVWQAGANANLGNFGILLSNVVNSPVTAVTDPASYNGVYLANTPISYAVGQTFLVVGKIEFNKDSTANDVISLYLNPSDLSDESSLVPYMYIDHADIGAITGFRVFAGATSGAFTASAGQFDEIRFGTTYASVTGTAVEPVSPWQTWLNLHFTAPEQAQPAVAGDTADPDADGRSNLLEYALGTTPRSADTAATLVVRAPAGFLALDYPVPAADLTYTPETSTDLVTWVTTGITDASAGPGLRTATVPQPTTGRAFLRLRVTRTP